MSTMPDLAQSYHGFHHTVDSALEVLANMNVSAHRITLRMAGRGMPSRWIVSQTPAAGKPLSDGDTITLEVAGLGYFHNLPVALWDAGGESRMGTREILAAIDDPYQKAAHWLREGARLFDISPTNQDACGRWITLFGLNPEDWPPEKWYSLAVLLPSLQSMAGKENGIRFALSLMLGLPLEKIRRSPRFRQLPETELSRLARQYARLGVDSIVGNRIEDLAELTLVLGPVTLDTYYACTQEDQQYLLNQVLYLVTPCHQRYTVAWSLEDRRRAPQLGIAAQNSRLGLNSYLGALHEP